MAKILLVEDEINIASFIERGLKEFGHTVTVCHDGNAGWKILQDEPFDLLILDIIMPKINGLELCRLYRQTFGYQSPVIMLTALSTTEDIVKDWMREQMIISSSHSVSKNWRHASRPC